MKVRKLALTAMLLALAIVLGWVEQLVPLPLPVPGIKLGLGNIMVLYALYALDSRTAFVLSAAKVLLSALLFCGFSGLLYSAAGALLSYAVMLAAKHFGRHFSPVGVSAAGGAAHVCAQVCVAVILTAQPSLWRLMAPLMFVGTVSGALTGLVTALLLRRLDGIAVQEASTPQA
ncbi:MAG: Gx transporter family protein [Ruminococcaceae bacterium]|nr:Gx transporter family protein [Oscillospiraceae bacterium]